ncbi:MAG TPA: hypothetical protein VED01_18140 [Burkholderiales bacterium]|nr:hypothetical protein [Burkholderiales bacterium]
MRRYDPSQAPDPREWLALDEQERMLLVEQHHQRARIKVPDLTAHSIIHAVVENQLAQNDEPVVRALVRLTKQGLSRHDAIHAIGSVVTTQIFDALQSKQPVQRDAYYAEIETLTADKWLRSNAG